MTKTLPIVTRPEPQSADSERGLISSILQDAGKTIELCLSANVTEDHFFHPCRKAIFRSILEMKKLDKPVEPISLVQYLEDIKILEDVGGAVEISAIYTFVPTAANAGYYIEILREKMVLRTALKEAQEVTYNLGKCQNTQAVFDEVTGSFKKTRELCSSDAKDDVSHKSDVIAYVEKMEEAANGTRKIEHFTTCLPTLDGIMGGGYMRGQLVIIHAPTSCGKSILSYSVAKENALRRGHESAIYSFEMMKDECIGRLISNEGEISTRCLQNAKFTQGELNRFIRASTAISEAPLTIYDINRCKPTPIAIEASIRKHHRKKPLAIAVIDYLGLLKFPAGKNQQRMDQDLQAFSSSLKLLAQEINCVIILVTQANEKGSVFNSSQVESDADYVLTIIPKTKMINGQKKILGAESLFVQKARPAKRGDIIPVLLQGEYSRICEPEIVSQKAA